MCLDKKKFVEGIYFLVYEVVLKEMDYEDWKKECKVWVMVGGVMDYSVVNFDYDFCVDWYVLNSFLVRLRVKL